MKNFLLLLVAIAIFLMGKMLALIVIYASPDNQPHLRDASFFFLASSIFLFYFFYYSKPSTSLWKAIYAFIGLLMILNGLSFLYICIYDERISYLASSITLFTFLVSNLLTFIGFGFMLKRSYL